MLISRSRGAHPVPVAAAALFMGSANTSRPLAPCIGDAMGVHERTSDKYMLVHRDAVSNMDLMSNKPPVVTKSNFLNVLRHPTKFAESMQPMRQPLPDQTAAFRYHCVLPATDWGKNDSCCGGSGPQTLFCGGGRRCFQTRNELNSMVCYQAPILPRPWHINCLRDAAMPLRLPACGLSAWPLAQSTCASVSM